MTSFCTWQTRTVLENNGDILFLLPVTWCKCNVEWINTNSAFCGKHHNLEKHFAVQTVARNNNLLYLADEQILTFPCKLVFSLLVIFPPHLLISYQQKQMPSISCWKEDCSMQKQTELLKLLQWVIFLIIPEFIYRSNGKQWYRRRLCANK